MGSDSSIECLSQRESGILCHPTSLPGPNGIGEIGPHARAFVDSLSGMGQRLWQILPHGPTSYGDSPYQSLSTFAGNPLWISFDDLVAEDLLAASRLRRFPRFDPHAVDFGSVIGERTDVLRSVCRQFRSRASQRHLTSFERFCRREAYWLDDYALFCAIKEAHGQVAWTQWPQPLALREPEALQKAARQLRTALRHVKILQYLFHYQWAALRRHCRLRKVRIIGDIPIFVAHDSADVWAHPELFHLDGRGEPSLVAGVPPDYFSATGQRWGNPLYHWDIHQRHGFDWWIRRMRKTLAMVDIVRIDHFRGFEAYWEIPAHEPTAMNGRWVEGPREALFDALSGALGRIPVIAEDLGVITEGVELLRRMYRFPGMRVLHFCFGEDLQETSFNPRRFPEDCVAYTGTHDNDTTIGWFHGLSAEDRQRILAFLGADGQEIHWDLIRLAAGSAAQAMVVPLQDVLGLGTEARMNRPGSPLGNWRWRFTADQLTPEREARMLKLCETTGRAPAK